MWDLDHFLIVFFFLAFVVLSPIFTVLVAPCPIVVPSFSWQRHISVICISPRSSLRHSDYGLAEIPPPFCQRNIKNLNILSKKCDFCKIRKTGLTWRRSFKFFFSNLPLGADSFQKYFKSWQFWKYFKGWHFFKVFRTDTFKKF